jgi:hypothetical protein
MIMHKDQTHIKRNYFSIGIISSNLQSECYTPRPPLTALRQSQLHHQVHLINQLRASHSTLMVVLLSRVVTPQTGPYGEVLRKKA